MKDFRKITQTKTKKNDNFNWTSEQQQAFEILKHHLCSEPLLQYPDFSKTFYLTTDESNYAIGSILSQGKPANDLPVAYARRTLNRAESNYSTIECELLSKIWSVKHLYLRTIIYNT